MTRPLVRVENLTKRFPIARNAFRRATDYVHAVDGISFDIEEEAPVRGPDGFCVPCRDGEAGEMLCPIKAFASPAEIDTEPPNPSNASGLEAFK